MKRSCALLTLLALALLLSCAAFAAEEYDYVIDEVGILSESEFNDLNARAEAVSEKHQMTVRIVIVDDYTDYSKKNNTDIWEVSDEMYHEYGFGYGDTDDGVLLLISLDERDFDTGCYGDARDAVTDYGKLYLDDELVSWLRNDNWYEGFLHYIEGCDELFGLYEDGEPMDGYVDYSQYQDEPENRGLTGGKLAAILGIPSAISGIFVGTQSAKMKSVRKKRDAATYIVPNSMNLTSSQDIFTHTTESRVKVQSESSGSSGGSFHSSSGGGSHHSGKF